MTIFRRFIKFGLIIVVLFLSSIFITYLSLLYKPESIFFIANKTIAKNYSFEYSEINSKVSFLNPNISVDNILIRDDIGFIKIDVEGHELECLKGAERILKTYKPNLLIEINKVHNKNYNQIFNFLKNLNYSSFYYDNKKLIKIFNYDENPREDYKNFIFKKN